MRPAPLTFLTLLLVVAGTSAFPGTGDRIFDRPRPLSLPLRRHGAGRDKAISDQRILRRQALPAGVNGGGNDTVRVTPGLYDVGMSEFAIPISIGTPAREFLLLFDTGSTDTWVVGPSCTNTTACAADNVYDPKASSTYASTPYDFSLNYTIGSSNGTYVADQVTVDDAVIAQQMFAVVNSTQHFFTAQNPESDHTIDGILGAGYPWGSSLQARYNVSYLPIPFALYAAHLIPKPVFSVYMGRMFRHLNAATTAAGNVDPWTGSVTFGAVNTSVIDEQAIRYTNVTQYQEFATNKTGHLFWEARANRISTAAADDSTTVLAWNETYVPSFVIDTGSNYFGMPEEDALALVTNHLAPEARRRQEQGGYYVDCSNPNLNATTVSIHLYQSDLQHGETFALTFPVSDLIFDVGDDQCILAISPGSHYVIGNFILYRFLSIFDFGENRVGFAPLREFA